jgi:electron transport complex protein RnfE
MKNKFSPCKFVLAHHKIVMRKIRAQEWGEKVKKMNPYGERLWNGMVTENPTFVLMLGMCPTLAVTSSTINGIGMGLSTLVALTGSNIMISAMRKIIPQKVRIPIYIVVIATFVTMVQLLLQVFTPGLYEALGIYIPLIVVNCIIFGRVESYAAKNSVLMSALDGVGMGAGFTIGLALIGMFREVIGNGTIFNFKVTPESYEPAIIFILAPGAFIVLAMLTAIQNWFQLPPATNNKGKTGKMGCDEECGKCGGCKHIANLERIHCHKMHKK